MKECYDGYRYQYTYDPCRHPEYFDTALLIIYLSDIEILICYIEIEFNPFPNKPWFSCVCNLSLLKTMWEKEKLLVMSNFSFSHSVFYPFGEIPAIFIQLRIVVCKLFQLG